LPDYTKAAAEMSGRLFERLGNGDAGRFPRSPEASKKSVRAN